MEETLRKWLSLPARLLLGLVFLGSGIGKVQDFSGTAEVMASKNMPMPSFLLVGAIVFLFVGSLSLFAGFKARFGALLLILFLIPATLIFHNFWAMPEEMQEMQMIQFLKNLSIMGGLLMVMAQGPGALSVDERGK